MARHRSAWMGFSSAKTRMRNRLGVWAVAVAGLIGSGAVPVAADVAARAAVSDIAGSERLQMFAYGKLLATGMAPRPAVLRMKQAMVVQGFYYDPGAKPLIAHDVWVAPVLRYDGNINGGVLRDSFSFRGFTFDTTPAFRAKAGAVVGLDAGGSVRLGWDNGRYIEAGVRGEAVWSPRYQIGGGSDEAHLCSRNHLTGWTFLDLCHSVSAVARALGSSTSQTTDLALSQLFAAGPGYHELTASLARQGNAMGDQTAVSLAWNAVWDRAATNLSLTYAAPIMGQTALRRRVALGVRWPWRGQNLGLDLWQQAASGGTFLGTARADRATGIDLSYEIARGLTTEVGYMINRSTVDFFRYDQLSVTLRIDNLRW